jgi:flagellar motor switch protein FliN/FliY
MSEDTEQPVDQNAKADDWDAAMEQQGGDSGSDSANSDELKQVEAPSLQASSSAQSGDVNMEVILDIPVTIAMEIGRTKLSIRNLLQLNQGSVVELDRMAGEPMDVLVNGTLVAHGEVVVVNEKFGIRLTDVISPADRIKNLR